MDCMRGRKQTRRRNLEDGKVLPNCTPLDASPHTFVAKLTQLLAATGLAQSLLLTTRPEHSSLRRARISRRRRNIMSRVNTRTNGARRARHLIGAIPGES